MIQIKRQFQNPKRYISVFTLGFFAFFLGLALLIPLIKDGMLQGKDDLSYHLNRILSIADGIKGGQFPVLIYPDALSGYGYASPLFYPDLFLYPPAILVAIGLPLSAVYVFYIMVLMFLAEYFYFLFARKIFSERGAIFAGVLYMGGHFFYAVVIYMAGLGQALAGCFVPLMLLGIYNMLREGFSKPWILLLGVLGVTFSHTLSLVVYAFMLIVIVLVNAKKLFTDKIWWMKVGILIGLYIGICAFYFFPMLEQFSDTKFLQSQAWAYVSEYAYSWKYIFGYGNPLLRRGTMRFSIGLVAFVSLFLRIMIKRTDSNKKTLQKIDCMIAIIVILQLFVTNLFPWKLFDKTAVNVIQFPFRLLMVDSLLIPLTIALIIREWKNSPRWNLYRGLPIVASLCIVIVGTVYDLMYIPEWNRVDTDEARLHEYIGTGEWLPLYDDIENIGTYRILFENQSILDSKGEVIPYQKEKNQVGLIFEGNAGETYELPILYYKGYVALDENGRELNTYPSSKGKVIVECEASGMISLEYHTTIIQKTSMAVTTIFTIASVVWLVWIKSKK